MANERLAEIGKFLVSVSVQTGNKIRVEIDGMDGVGISDCVSVSRNIEHNLDREEEDFELEVTTAGLDQAFKVPEQYQKNVGREVQVKLKEGGKIKGKLVKAERDTITLEEKRKERVEGKKKKVEITEQIELDKGKIEETKIVISF